MRKGFHIMRKIHYIFGLTDTILRWRIGGKSFKDIVNIVWKKMNCEFKLYSGYHKQLCDAKKIVQNVMIKKIVIFRYLYI